MATLRRFAIAALRVVALSLVARGVASQGTSKRGVALLPETNPRFVVCPRVTVDGHCDLTAIRVGFRRRAR